MHGRTSLTRLSLSISTCSSLSFLSTSCTPSCTLSSTTRSSWKACATPPTRRVRTPTTFPSHSHFFYIFTAGDCLPQKFQHQEEVKVRSNLHRRTRRVNPQKSKNFQKMTTKKNYRVMSCKVCLIVQAWIGR